MAAQPIERPNVFNYEDYKTYLLDTIASLPAQGRGFRSRIARALKCQNAYVSQVLNRSLNFTLEQGLVISRLVGFSEDQKRYFLLLIEKARAGTPELVEHFKREMQELRERQTLLRERFRTRAKLTSQDEMIYYSEWFYAAIHVLVSVPHFQDIRALAGALGLGEGRVREALDFLIGCGLIRQEKGRFTIGENRIHLGSDSPSISKHHLNWRLQAMRSLEKGSSRDLHYTSVVSLSEQDYQRLRSLWIEAMENHNQIVAPSTEEVVYCLALDLFGVA